MESNGNSKSGLLTAGGVLSIIGGALEVIAGGIVVALILSNVVRDTLLPLLPMPLPPWGHFGINFIPIALTFLGIVILVLGVIAIVGGISALNRKSFGLSLAGAICALPSVILGILAVIFVSVAKKEFEAQK
jgi:ABC-type multidrug transport system permease subunit